MGGSVSRYSFCIVTSGRFEWACHDTIECIVTGEQGRCGRWLCRDITQPRLRYDTRLGLGRGTKKFCIVTIRELETRSCVTI